MAAHLTVEQRELAWRLKARGLGASEIARQVGCTRVWVYRLEPEPKRTVRPLGFEPGPGRLSLAEREEIFYGVRAGLALREIARRLGRAPSTISREVAATGGREHYRAYLAHRRAFEVSRRPKTPKLANAELAGVVASLLECWWSPRQISRHLKRAFANDPMMQVSYETIYQSLYVQGRGELRKELVRCLRSGRAKRKAHGRLETRGRIKHMVNISERPAEVADRAVPGHWEGDLLAGAGGKSHIATLVERSTRYVMLAKIPNAKAQTVASALSALVTRLPTELWRSLTWDQGSEMAAHEFFSMTTGIPVYFCDPHSPWQRGSNENTNGLLRQYFPKGTSLRGYSQEDLDKAAISLNGRPRETLDWETPAERLTALLVADTA
jgi:transposase, IS30 family